MNCHLRFNIMVGMMALLLFDCQQIWAQSPVGNNRMFAPKELGQKIEQLHVLIRENNEDRKDISKAVDLDRQSREAYRSGDYEKASRLIDEAIFLIRSGTPAETYMPRNQLQETVSRKYEENHKTIELKVDSEKVFLTRAVPGFNSGKHFVTMDEAFPTNTVTAMDGKVCFEISAVPVFVEVDEMTRRDDNSIPAQSVPLDSPFGGTPITMPFFDHHYRDIGVKWIRYSGMTMSWDMVERIKGVYDWSGSDNLFRETIKNGIHPLVTVRSFNRWDQPDFEIEKRQFMKTKAPNDLASYLNFLANAVERYDGDGAGDAPDSPVVSYWQIENEIDGNFWGDTPENYARLLKSASKTIKKVNPNAKIVIAGASSVEGFSRFYVPVLRTLRSIADKPGDRYFDIFDVHWYGNAGEYKNWQGHELQGFINNCNKTLEAYGYSNVPMWITETGTHGGRGVVGKKGELLPEQDETIQACELVQRYVYFLGSGIKKVFWSHMTEERHRDGFGTANDYFENVGLIRNPRNSGDSSKKLAFYSYRFLIQKLEGSMWEKTHRIDLGTGIIAFRFMKNGKSIFVIWNDQFR